MSLSDEEGLPAGAYGEAPPGRSSPRDEDRSDLFSVKAYSGGVSIPRIDRVPPTREERMRQLAVRTAIAIATLVALALVIAVSWWAIHRMRIGSALAEASDTGRVAALEHALALLEEVGGDTVEARRVQVRGMLRMAGEPIEADLGAALAAIPEDGGAGKARAVAATYAALAAGDLEAAMRAASDISPSDSGAAEAAHARALAARAVGNVQQALASAQVAVEQRPQAPRHVALYAELLARAGDPDAAIARLDELGAERQGAAVALAKARILDAGGVSTEEVGRLARLALEDALVTPHETAWAHVLLARVAAARGDRVGAREELARITDAGAAGDEAYVLTLIEVALRVGMIDRALRAAEGLPSPLSVDAARRSQIDAELALARHDLRRATAALAHAPAGPRTALARGRLLEAQDEMEDARARYREASADPRLRVPALVHLASLELSDDEAGEALSLLRPLLRETPEHPDLVPVAVRAHLALDDAAAARALVEPALATHPQDVRLLASRALVEMAEEGWDAALSTFASAIALEEDDADLHSGRGRAAAQLGRRDLARASYDRALALSPSHPEALLGRLELALDEEEPAVARRTLTRIDDAELRSLAVERLRGRLLTMEVAGQSGLSAMRRALGRHRRDPSLTISLGWLYAQAEQYGSAVRTLGRITQRDDAPLEARLARILAQVRMRASNPAAAALESLLEDLDVLDLPESLQADIRAIQARLAVANGSRPLAIRQSDRALALDPGHAEAHLVRADLLLERDRDPTEELEAALAGPHPSSRPLAQLALRAETVDDRTCELAGRYRRAAPNGQFSRGVWRLLRDCRDR